MKRPLIIILGAYLSGILFAWKAVSTEIVVASIVLTVFGLYILMYWVHNRYINRTDRTLWCIPILLLVGFLSMGDRMRPPEGYDAFDQKVACELSGKIKMIVEKEQGQALYVTNNVISFSNRIVCLGQPTAKEMSYSSEAIIIFTSVHHNYQVGNQITAYGTLIKFQPASNPGQFNEKLYYQIENIDYKLQADRIEITSSDYSWYHMVLGSIKSRLIKVYSSILKEKEAGTLIAMLLGEKYLLEDEIKQLYQTGGISHVLAISGLHVSLIGMAILWLLKKCRLPKIPSTILTVFLLFCYGELTNFSVSTNRAFVMMTVLLFASLFGKTYDMLSATAFSAFLILLQNPLQLFSAGFLLSYSAILGIALLYPGLKRLFTQKSKVLDALLLSVSATLATTPIVLVFYYQFPTYGILTNLLILPFITILTLVSLIAGLVGLVCLPLGIFLIGGPNYILKLYEGICKVNASFPGSLITVGKPGIILVLLSVGFMMVFVLRSKSNPRWYQLLYLVVGFLTLFVPHINHGLEITMLDVGQGEGSYIESEGTNYLIDGGSADIRKIGTYRLLPFLKSQGVNQLDYAIVTHCDEDHISGLRELIEGELIRIDRLILPEIKQKDENYLILEKLAREKKIGIHYISEGDSIVNGVLTIKGTIVSGKNDGYNGYGFTNRKNTLQIYCLHPEADAVHSSSNSYSTVLSISYHELDLMLTGDLDSEGEEQIKKKLQENYFLKKYQITPAIDYDVLKIAHHGSKYSTSEEFLNFVKPEFSLISCSRNNWYGHPHPQLLSRLNKIGSRKMITYERGAVMIKTNGYKMEVKGYLKQGTYE